MELPGSSPSADKFERLQDAITLHSAMIAIYIADLPVAQERKIQIANNVRDAVLTALARLEQTP